MTTPTIERQPHRCARNDRCVNRVQLDQVVECPCACHGMCGAYATCDIEGGCGHLHREPEDDQEPLFEGGPILTLAGLCEGCTRRVVAALEDYPLDYVELSLLIASGELGVFTEVTVSSTGDLQVPIRVSVEALRAAMVFEAQAWAEPVAERLGIDWDTDRAARCRPGFVLQRAARLLAAGVDTLATLPEQAYRAALDCDWVTRDGIDGAIELLRLHDLTRFTTGQAKLVHQLPAPCPRCERMTLVRHNGCEHVTCGGCGVRWPESDYKRLTLVLAEDYRELVA